MEVQKELSDLRCHFEREMVDFRKALEGKKGCEEFKIPDLDTLESRFNTFEAKVLMSLNTLDLKLERMGEKVDDLENYSRRHCLIFHGIEETEMEKTDEVISQFASHKFGVSLSVDDIERSHRLGKPKVNGKRPIIARFNSYKKRQEIFSLKKKLKGQDCMVTESLSKMRLQLFKATKDVVGLDCWTRDGVVFAKTGETLWTIRKMADLEELRKHPKGKTRNKGRKKNKEEDTANNAVVSRVLTRKMSRNEEDKTN